MRTKKILGILALLSLVFVAACGTSEDGAPHGLGVQFFMATGTQFHGDSTLDCGDCHGGTIGNCTRCHFGPSGARVPDGVTWTHGDPHTGVGFSLNSEVGDVCNKCHGMTRKYSDVPGSCHDCH